MCVGGSGGGGAQGSAGIYLDHFMDGGRSLVVERRTSNPGFDSLAEQGEEEFVCLS